ncbi:RelA/SpoT domain-containing protein [Nocardia sp. NBC_01327]|uniref:RelA/SpoT domain-containing protein n=1 Tax=Nocardia sp. NBC_01327 TaxID=2903593 RepID=UPI002E15242E|nr:RelA/SpoT domain-containing protein [Nocardia sp. NBC_01327]
MTGTTTPDVFAEDSHHALVPNHLWAYAHDHAHLAEAAEELQRFLADIANEASITVHTIQARAKTLASYQDKSLKKLEDGAVKYPDPKDAETGIQDCIAARAILYTSQARNDFADQITRRVTAGAPFNPGDEKHNGYDSVHVIVKEISNDVLKTRYKALAKYLETYPGLEIQLRSVAAHAWAEYEHDIRYKSQGYQALSKNDRDQVDQFFVEAGGLRRFMDELFDRIEGLMAKEDDSTSPVDPDELTNEVGDSKNDTGDDQDLSTDTLRSLVEQRFPKYDVGENAAVEELISNLDRLGVRSIGRLKSTLAQIESDDVFSLMEYPVTPTGARRLDDELLTAFTERYVEDAPSDDRQQLLRLRLRKVRGKYAIYSIHNGETIRPAVPAARAVRDLAQMVATDLGIDAALIESAIALDVDELKISAKPVAVSMPGGELQVATNLSRPWAEEILKTLMGRATGSGWSVTRAGDLLVEAPSAVDPGEPATGDAASTETVKQPGTQAEE